MGFTFACPSCREEIHASEGMEGLHGRCPHCAATFTIPEQAGAFRRDGPTGPARRSARDDELPHRIDERLGPPLAPGWIGVRNGLLLVRISTIIAIFVALGLVLLIALASGIVPLLDRNRQAEMILGTLFIVAALVAVGSAILALIGQFMCCSAPESGTKGLAIGSVVCLVLTLLLVAGAILATIVQDQRRVRPFGMPQNDLRPIIAALNILSMVLGTVGHVLFGFFLKGIANFFENSKLSKSAGAYLILFGVFVGSCLVVLVMLIVVGASLPRDVETTRILFLVLGVGLLVFALVLVLWFLDLVGRARSTIATALQEGW